MSQNFRTSYVETLGKLEVQYGKLMVSVLCELIPELGDIGASDSKFQDHREGSLCHLSLWLSLSLCLCNAFILQQVPACSLFWVHYQLHVLPASLRTLIFLQRCI